MKGYLEPIFTAAPAAAATRSIAIVYPTPTPLNNQKPNQNPLSPVLLSTPSIVSMESIPSMSLTGQNHPVQKIGIHQCK